MSSWRTTEGISIWFRHIYHIRRSVQKKTWFFQVRSFNLDFFRKKLGGVLAESSRREASTWTFFDRLDIFSNATDEIITMALYIFCRCDIIGPPEKTSFFPGKCPDFQTRLRFPLRSDNGPLFVTTAASVVTMALCLSLATAIV